MQKADPDRPLASASERQKAHRRTMLLKLALLVALIFSLGFLVSRLNLRRDMSRLDLAMVSGASEGNYHALVTRLSERAKGERGNVRNVATEGSADNVRRLAAARGSCDVEIGLAQDGTDWGDPKPVLLGRLPKAESVFFFGKDADRITEFAQLAKMKIGAGPEGSGAAAIAKTLFDLPELKALEVSLDHRPTAEQLVQAQKGELDLAIVVMDEDAAQVTQAVRERGLQIAGFSHADAIARRIPHLRTGRIGAGEYDAVKLLPPTDKRVFRVETLLLGNECTGRAETIDVLMLVAREFPDFLRHNKETPNATGIELSTTSRELFERGGPEVADEYVPWLVDIMPPANWAYVVMGISLLFNAMGFGHRFRLWRIDAARVGLEAELVRLFGPSTTVGDIARMPAAEARAQEKHIAHVIVGLEALAARSRRYSLSMLVPMGQEMAYRYQEELMHQTLAALRELLRRGGEA